MKKIPPPDHPAWFDQWQRKFYNSASWKRLRDQVRAEQRMRCQHCSKLIKGISIVDHIQPITPQTVNDQAITMGRNNLQLLCINCHNSKTFSLENNFDLETRRFENLF